MLAIPEEHCTLIGYPLWKEPTVAVRARLSPAKSSMASPMRAADYSRKRVVPSTVHGGARTAEM